MSPRVTLNEACAIFRQNGISISSPALADGIQAGKYPFGRVRTGTGQRRVFEIWRKDVEAFIESLKEPVDTTPASDPARTVVAEQITATVAIPAKALQVAKWARICSNPRHQESDCASCPYRNQGICYDSLLADAAGALMDMTLAVSSGSHWGVLT